MKAVEELSLFLKRDDTFKWNNVHKVQYISLESYETIMSIISKARRNKEIDVKQYDLIRIIYTEEYNKGVRLREVIRNLPKTKAELFLRKKWVRKTIFERDKVCLRCGTNEYLTLDHIKPVSKGGENTIENLQTLCRSCNSFKRDFEIDFRR